MTLSMEDRIDVAISRRPDFEGVALVTIAHDSWCGRLRGGACNCVPDIEMLHNGERVGVDALGNFKTVSGH
jgi:hypothetical protein